MSMRLVLTLIAVLVATAVFPALASGAGAGSFAPPHADSGVDTNGDRLFNYLRIGVNIQIDVAGAYKVLVVLNDDFDLGELSRASVTQPLPSGSHQVPVLLDGADIYNGGVDGPWHAHLTLLDGFGSTLATGAHTTSAYGFADFQSYAARIVPPASERTLDNDTDGLANWIDVSITVDVATPAAYTLTSLLTDTTYTIAEEWTQTVALAAGRTTLHQLFLGYPIRLAQRSGPYLVTNSLSRADGALIDFLYLETQAYAYTSFETPPAWLSPPYVETGEDPDGDGLFSTLRVDVGLGVDVPGTYTVRGELASSGGQPIQDTVARVTLAAGVTTVALRFTGSTIYSSGMSGPYVVTLTLFDVALRTLGSGTHSTSAYAYDDFEPRILTLAPPYEDLGVDSDGDGQFEALRMIVRADVSIAATIRVDIVLRQGVSMDELFRVSRTTAIAPGPLEIAVDIPGADFLGAGLDGPYRLWIEAYDGQGTLLDQDNHRTQEYTLSQFEPGARARISGIFAQAPEDVDSDGSFNRLRIRVGIEADAPGRYRLAGSLGSGGLTIAEAAATVPLGAGPGVVDLVFAGPELRAAGLNGPFDLAVSLSSGGATPTPYDATVLQTDVFAASAFEPAVPITISGHVVSEYRSAPLAGATVWLLDYVNHVSRSVPTDALGYYSLSAYRGSYWVLVDHPGGQARVWPQTFSGDAVVDATLPFARRDVVDTELTWTGWDRLLVSVRYLLYQDAPSVRFQLDWTLGDRDGRVRADEAALLRIPASAIRGVLDTGDSASRVVVNGARYVAVDAPVWSDETPGDVTSSATPALRLSRTFAPETAVGTPGRIQIVVESLFDTMEVNQRTRLFIPGSYRYVASDSSANVIVAGRKIPYAVDPDLPPPDAGPDAIARAEFLLFFQAAYSPPIPAAPGGLYASVAGSSVTLGWSRPTSNLDESRISNLAGYQVYRRTSASQPPQRANPQIVTVERFEDVPGAGTFLYSVAAVNTDGTEGPRSAETQVTIPSSVLTVSVVDLAGGPVSGVDLTLTDAGGRRMVASQTDERGVATLIAPRGSYTLRLSGVGIIERSVAAVMEGDRSALTVVVERTPASTGLSGLVIAAAVAGLAVAALGLARSRIRRRRASSHVSAPPRAP